jgi:hypothetical protein
MSSDEAAAQAQADARALIEEIAETRAVLHRRAEVRAAKDSERRAIIENARRSGEHGRDWQVLQQRIDLHETTQSDILNGLDHSAEARAVRKVAGEGLARLRTAYRTTVSEPDPELHEQLTQLAAARAGLDAEQRRLSALDADL